MQTISRDIYLKKLISKKHNRQIKVITGLRRCGKSFLLSSIFKDHLKSQGVADDHIIEISFDSVEGSQFCDPYVCYTYLKEHLTGAGMYYVLLDEVQLLGKFETVLNSLIRMENADVYVTGSNAKFLSKDVITEFRGRGDQVKMHPLSFSEFMSVYPGTKFEGWTEYITYGGLPMIFDYQTDEEKSEFLKSIFVETYIRDIEGRNKIRNPAELEDIINILSSSVGSLTNPNKLSNTFQSVKHKTLSAPTIRRYLDILSDAFLIDSAMRYDVRGKKYIDTPLKYYFTDLGLRNARLNFRQIEETHVLENVIFNELKLRGYNVDIGVVTQNLKQDGKSERKQLEIDFVCNLGSKRYYIQSAFMLPDEEKVKQEVRPLMLSGDFFKKIVITTHTPVPHYDNDGILFMNVFDFLLNPRSLEF